MNKIVLYCILLLNTTVMNSQVSPEMQNPLESKGTLPSEILKDRSKKIKEAINNTQVSYKEKKKDIKKKKSFEASNALAIDGIMFSGNTLFNDELGNYLNSIKDELLKNNPDLKSQVKVYMIKSPIANAFTLHDGKIFFNIGLLNYLKTEAEIAFVIAHEISHFTQKHTTKQFEYNMEKKPNSGIDKKEKFYEQNQFSQEHEKEADQKALELLYNSKYKYSSSFKSMESLELSEYTAFDYKFNRNWISNNNLKLDNWFELDTIKPIVLISDEKILEMEKASKKTIKEQLEEEKKKEKEEKMNKKKLSLKKKEEEEKAKDENIEEEDKDDKNQNCFKSTHPESPVRKKILKDKISKDGKNTEEGEDFLVKTKEEFEAMILKSKIESTRQLMINHEYELASYYSGGLMNLDSTNPYYRKLFAKSFGAYALYSGKYWHNIHLRFNRTKGNYMDYLYMLYTLYKSDKALIQTAALNFAYNEYKKYPDDQELQSICVAIANRLKKDFDIDKSYFKSMSKATLDTKNTKPKKEVYPKDKKEILIKKTKKSKKSNSTSPNKDFTKNSLSEFSDEKTFKDIFLKADNYSKNRDLINNGKKNLKELEKSNDGIIKKVVLISPRIDKYKIKELTPDIFEKIEARSKEFEDQINECAQLAGLNIDILNPRNFEENDINKLNDITRLDEYFTNFTDNDIVYKPNMTDMVFLDNLREKYQTDHVMFLGVKRFKSSMALPIFFSFFSFPYTLPELLIGGKAYYYYAVVINLSTGDIDYLNEYGLKMKDNKKVQKGILYSIFKDVRNTKYRVEFTEK